MRWKDKMRHSLNELPLFAASALRLCRAPCSIYYESDQDTAELFRALIHNNNSHVRLVLPSMPPLHIDRDVEAKKGTPGSMRSTVLAWELLSRMHALVASWSMLSRTAAWMSNAITIQHCPGGTSVMLQPHLPSTASPCPITRKKEAGS